MFEALVALLVLGTVVVGALMLFAGLVKLLFKLVLLPVWIVLAVVKWTVVALVGLAVAIVVGPVVVAILAVLAIPLLLVGGLVWAGVAILT